ncbi:BPSS1780 family membrane protein [Crenobacter cavernae]|uniref:DUF2189 domain-containing protein n=1 Tax=Crenobacter cavernae TaxID=2290923 RepID=A0A345Y4N9_9NEIS|nr:BPSS1780 family membrane protein [Crenobacter cavernae]AXK38891.1 hypothetical protein DWG20_05280 [Crenobacter cavernae]
MSDFFTDPAPPRPTPVLRPLEPRRVAAGRGWRWIVDAFYIVRTQPLTWVLMSLAYLVLAIVAGLVPVVGDAVVSLLSPVFVAGFILAAIKAEQGGELEVGDLFAGFRSRVGPLVVLGAAYLLLILVALLGAVLLAALFGAGTGLLTGDGLADGADPAASLGLVLVVALPILVAVVLASMAYWFAPALIITRDIGVLDAMKLSFKASLANWPAMLVASLALAMLLFLAVLPLFLGLLLWMPVVWVCYYTSWKDVFGDA